MKHKQLEEERVALPIIATDSKDSSDTNNKVRWYIDSYFTNKDFNEYILK